MFTHMVQVKQVVHAARNTQYELQVYQVVETGEYRIYVSKHGLGGVGDIFVASQTDVLDAKATQGVNLIDELISIARETIDHNEFNQY